MLGEQPVLPYCIQDHVPLYLGCDHDSQSRVQTKKRRGMRVESHVCISRRLRFVHANNILFGNTSWTFFELQMLKIVKNGIYFNNAAID